MAFLSTVYETKATCASHFRMQLTITRGFLHVCLQNSSTFKCFVCYVTLRHFWTLQLLVTFRVTISADYSDISLSRFVTYNLYQKLFFGFTPGRNCNRRYQGQLRPSGLFLLCCVRLFCFTFEWQVPTVTVSKKLRSKGLPPLQMGVFEEKSSHTPGMHWVSR